MKRAVAGAGGGSGEAAGITRRANAANTALVAGGKPYDLMYLHYLMARIAVERRGRAVQPVCAVV